VNGRIDPATALRKQHLPVVWGYGEGMGITNELRFGQWEVLQQQGSQITILAEMEQVFHMQCVHSVLGVILDDLVSYQQGLLGVGSPQTIECETTRKTSDGAEETLEGLCHVMRNKVLIDLYISSAMIDGNGRDWTNLHHRDNGLFGIRQLSLTATTENLLVVYHSKTSQSDKRLRITENLLTRI
jgi:hypothetical protein